DALPIFRWDGGKLRLKRAEDSPWQPVDEIVSENADAIKAGWEGVKGIPVIGDVAEFAVGGVGNAFAAYDENIIQPVVQYAKATDRHYINLMEKHDQTGDFRYAAEGLGTLLGFGGLIGGDEFDEEYENAARYSIGQQVVAEATGKFTWDAETGRMVSPLLDDPNLEQERQEYFSSGWQRFFSGTLDMAANIGLDPARYGTAGVGVVIKKVSTANEEVIESAGRTGRGAEAASIADEARWIETTDPELLAERTVKDLKEL